ncbi:MAG: hypothetical protein OER90_02465 [Gemmatimonadota bacterium]|nr:hypothetical protein [Gemmatimonadota bacterium]
MAATHLADQDRPRTAGAPERTLLVTVLVFSTLWSACGQEGPTQPLPASAAASLTIAPDSVLLLEHTIATLTASVRDSRGMPIADRAVIWRSLNSGLATVAPDGVVHALRAGRVWIHASVDSATDSALVDVRITLQSVSTGAKHSCGVTKLGSPYCWGANRLGQLGNGSTQPRAMPTSVWAPEPMRSITAGHGLTCGLSGSIAYCWGNNGSGQLGSGEKRHRWQPVLVQGELPFATVAVNTYHTCGIAEGGRGFCWGGDWGGQVGDGSGPTLFAPRAVEGDLEFETIDAGLMFSCGATADGRVFCWGYNDRGQLGRIDAPERCVSMRGPEIPCSTTPVPTTGNLTFESVVTGTAHACALAPDGQAYCWGDNAAGQLGIGSVTSTSSPTAVVGDLTFVGLTAGDRHTCGLDAAGVAYCWGDNAKGALGTTASLETCGTEPCSTQPIEVSGGWRFRMVSASRGPGGSHSCGVTLGGDAYCWGDNDAGQLGRGYQGGVSFEPVWVLRQLPAEPR